MGQKLRVYDGDERDTTETQSGVPPLSGTKQLRSLRRQSTRDARSPNSPYYDISLVQNYLLAVSLPVVQQFQPEGNYSGV